MEDFSQLMRRLLEIQSGGRQSNPELIAEDERLMVPRKKAARKLNVAAQNTASFGDRTRVDTIVAMLFAES